MIEIDDDLFRKREFSGRVIVSFDKGKYMGISIDETVHCKDPNTYHKLLKHGIRRKGENVSGDGQGDSPSPASSPQSRAGQG